MRIPYVRNPGISASINSWIVGAAFPGTTNYQKFIGIEINPEGKKAVHHAMKTLVGREDQQTVSEIPPAAKPLASAELISLLSNIKIWGDLDNEVELRRLPLSVDLRTVRFYDEADGLLVASLTDTVGRPLTAFEVANVMTWNVDYREHVWVSTELKAEGAGLLELWIQLVRTCDQRRPFADGAL